MIFVFCINLKALISIFKAAFMNQDMQCIQALISPVIEYWKKYHISMGVAEIFSILLERLTKKRIFLKSSLGITDDNLLNKLESRNNFMELFFVTFYSANSLMKSSFWKDHLSIEDSNLLYSKLIKDFTVYLNSRSLLDATSYTS